MLPEARPAAVGTKVAIKDVLAPAFKVNGKLKPVRLNPGPDAVA